MYVATETGTEIYEVKKNHTSDSKKEHYNQ